MRSRHVYIDVHGTVRVDDCKCPQELDLRSTFSKWAYSAGYRELPNGTRATSNLQLSVHSEDGTAFGVFRGKILNSLENIGVTEIRVVMPGDELEGITVGILSSTYHPSVAISLNRTPEGISTRIGVRTFGEKTQLANYIRKLRNKQSSSTKHKEAPSILIRASDEIAMADIAEYMRLCTACGWKPVFSVLKSFKPVAKPDTLLDGDDQ